MSKKQGLIQKELDKVFAQNNITAHEMGMTNALLLSSQQLKIYQLMEDVKADFPFKIYFDNKVDGENHYSFTKPGGSEITDIDEITIGVTEWLEKWFFGTKEKTGHSLINRRENKKEKQE
jgi:hypothetical protein